jgi:hypothetical protein
MQHAWGIQAGKLAAWQTGGVTERLYTHSFYLARMVLSALQGTSARFQSKAREIAGFAENQRYGLGTNSMTSGQKGALIWGSLLAFFGLFIAGYFVQ